MTFSIFIGWILVSVAVGIFANQHRNRSGGGWFLLSLLLSPLVAGLLLAALRPVPGKIDLHTLALVEATPEGSASRRMLAEIQAREKAGEANDIERILAAHHRK